VTSVENYASALLFLLQLIVIHNEK
jgi:hypothetical protein